MKKDSQNFSDLIVLIESHKQNAYRKVNEELVSMYYEIGQYLADKINKDNWGDKTINTLSSYIHNIYPTLKGFDRSGLYRMIQFYNTYKDYKNVAPLVRQISWSNNLIILSKASSMEEKEFYIKLCIKNNYTKRELERQISSNYYERYMLSSNNVSYENKLNEDKIFLPNTKLLDQYSFEFLDLPDKYSEIDLQKAIIKNLKYFILEIGKDFTFIGNEYKITVGDSDYYIDLLFYNRTFSCLVAIELKLGKFQPEYISKMDFYLEALDRQEKKYNENPSIGLILCSEKDNTVVEYAMSRSISQTMVSTYKTQLIDKKLLQNKLTEYRRLLDK